MALKYCHKYQHDCFPLKLAQTCFFFLQEQHWNAEKQLILISRLRLLNNFQILVIISISKLKLKAKSK
jgi:hypothetical protein